MMKLVDKTDFRAAQQGPPLIAETAAILAADHHGTGIGPLQQAGDVQ